MFGNNIRIVPNTERKIQGIAQTTVFVVSDKEYAVREDENYNIPSSYRDRNIYQGGIEAPPIPDTKRNTLVNGAQCRDLVSRSNFPHRVIIYIQASRAQELYIIHTVGVSAALSFPVLQVNISKQKRSDFEWQQKE